MIVEIIMISSFRGIKVITIDRFTDLNTLVVLPNRSSLCDRYTFFVPETFPI